MKTINTTIGMIAIALFLCTVYTGVIAQTNSSNQVSTEQNAARELLLEQKLSAKVITERFVTELAAIDLETKTTSDSAVRLRESFEEAATVILALEEAGDLAATVEVRDTIEAAVQAHMERQGAMEADISQNINAYSRYLTETLILASSSL